MLPSAATPPRRSHCTETLHESRVVNSADLLLQARAAHDAGAYEAARSACEALLAKIPDDPDALALLALVAADQGQVDEAMGWATRAVAAGPQSAGAHYMMGRLHETQDRLAEAESSYRRAVALAPAHARAHNNLGAVLHLQGRLAEALESYRRAVELDPDLPEANHNFASLGRDPLAFERAAEGLRRRLAAQPRDAASWNILGNACRELGRHAEAIDAYERAIAIDPQFADAHFSLGQVLLQCGDYRRGWQEFEWRLRTQALGEPARRFAEPVWHGRETAHTVLLHAEQGLGDTIQFARFAALVAPRCGAVVLECAPRLKTLFEGMKNAPLVVARGDPLPPFGMHAPLMSVPALLGTTLETIPWSGPYLAPLPVRVINWRRAFRKRRRHLNVGLCWAGRPESSDDRNRSTTLAQLAPLAAVPEVAFFSLQLGEAAAQAAQPPAGMQMHDLSSKQADFADSAALIGFMDLVITVDTSVAHCAGAMGRPTWVLLARAADWRYHVGRDDMPWYPTMRLFRQEKDGDWSAPVAKMAAELARMAEAKGRKA